MVLMNGIMMSKIYQEDVDAFALELYDFFQNHPLVLEDENEGYMQYHYFLEQRFEKYFSSLYDGDYRNYN